MGEQILEKNLFKWRHYLIRNHHALRPLVFDISAIFSEPGGYDVGTWPVGLAYDYSPLGRTIFADS
jgi:hypothetical protein